MNLLDETLAPGVGCRVWGLGCGFWGLGVGALTRVLIRVAYQGMVQDSFCYQGLWYQVQDSGFRVSAFGSRVQVLEFGVQSWSFENWGVLGRIHEDLRLLDALSGPASA